ncbi:MAG: AAA family ATPase [Bryobacteraceae bacterium]|jgi:general secretion pathway protein A
MYQKYFGLTKNPFSMTPDPSALFLTTAHREAIAGLSYGAFSRKGFVVLTGEAGTGKTTLLRRLVDLSKEMHAGCNVVFNPLLTSSEFLELLLFNFGVRDLPASKTQRLLKLEELLIETHKKRNTAVLIIDEAHKLSHEIFEEIRLLTNFETGEEKLLQIVLAGQPELKTVLNHPNLWQLKQRIAIRLHIDPLARYQIGPFVQYRWTRFGGTEPHPFSAEALDLIAQCSRGIPRLINAICDNALLIAFSRNKRQVDADIILDVVLDLDLSVPLEEPGMTEAAESPASTPETAGPQDSDNAHSLIGSNVSGSNGHRTGGWANASAAAASPAEASGEAAETAQSEPTPVAAATELARDSESIGHEREPLSQALQQSVSLAARVSDSREPVRVHRLPRRRPELLRLPILVRVLLRLRIVNVRFKESWRPQ